MDVARRMPLERAGLTYTGILASARGKPSPQTFQGPLVQLYVRFMMYRIVRLKGLRLVFQIAVDPFLDAQAALILGVKADAESLLAGFAPGHRAANPYPGQSQ